MDMVMAKIGFSCKWGHGIMEFVSTKNMSVFVNGSLTEEFKVGRGIRESDTRPSFFYFF